MKTAIIHDWLTSMRGGEKVLEAILEIFPDADIYTLIYKKGSINPSIESHKIHTSFVNKFPFAPKLYRFYNIFFPFAVEQFDLSEYDLVISSSHNSAKGVVTSPDTLHISYIHTPVRYYWDQYHEYFKKWNWFMKIGISFFSTFFRTWDVVNTQRVDYIIANSDFVGKRIKKYYGKDYKVIYPPADIEKFANVYTKSEDYYVIVSALEPYKRIDVAIEAFNISGKKLKIIGKGSYSNKLKSIAKNNIEFLGRISDEELLDVYSHAKAFIINSIEDFGIAPIEAQAAGLPVIAYGKGGALETVVNGKTGVFYESQSPDTLNQAVEKFEKINWDKSIIKANAARFSKNTFVNSLSTFINEKITDRNTNIERVENPIIKINNIKQLINKKS